MRRAVRLIDLCQSLFEGSGSRCQATLSRAAGHGLSQAVGAPRHHAQAEERSRILKSFPRTWTRSRGRRRRCRPDRGLFATRRASARRTRSHGGGRGRGPRRHTISAQPRPTSSAICPSEGKRAALVLPACTPKPSTCTWPRSQPRCARSPCRAPHRPGRMHLASRLVVRRTSPSCPPTQVPRAQPRRERLAVHAR